MSLALNDLLICCRQLEHDRATERRKEVDKFKRLIQDPETVQHLDRHSDSKQGKYLNWDAVFRFLQKYIQKEMESLRTAKSNVSATTQSSRQKKMQEISSLVRYFIKCANKRAPRLKCQDLLNYVMDTVKDSSNGLTYGADCSNILLKDILSVRKYWCEVSQQQWLELFSLYFRLYLKPSQDINRVLVARIIHAVTRGCCSQTDGLPSKFLDLFSKAIQYARQEKSSPGLSHILAALNIFLKSLAVNFRKRVCEAGDEILPTLLYIWTQHRLNDSLKEVIIELIQLQIYIHHPQGARAPEEGAYESMKWKSILYNLYDLLVNEISHIGSRGKYSSGSRNIAVKENLIDLMADICYQLFDADTRSVEISQSYVTQRESTDYSVPCKRRKIDVGWEVIKDYLQKSQSDFDLVPWLQITTRLISKYPSSLPNCELSPLILILYQLLPQQRRGELENSGELFSRSVTDRERSEAYWKWQKHSQLLKDSDFSFQEPLMALRTVILETLVQKEMERSQGACSKDILTKHLVEFSVLARTFKNTQLPERAIFKIKQYNSAICGISEWHLEEAQVFWAKKEQSLALSILKQMIKKLDSSFKDKENDAGLKVIYAECLRVCGSWLAETCLENPAVIMQTYLEKAVKVAGSYDGNSRELRNGQMKAFLSLARFSDTQYQRIENYMKSSEFENKQTLLKRAKEEVGLLREHKIQTNRYTVKVQRELELDECALRALREETDYLHIQGGSPFSAKRCSRVVHRNRSYW